jgi:hypothetical protein
LIYLLRKKKFRFLQISNSSILHYDLTEPDKLKKFIVATGLLNHIWQSWNQFWRAYWIAHIIGGKDLQNNRIVPLYPGLSEPQALYYLLTLIDKKKRGTTGVIKFSHQEATWGDIKVIQNLATQLSSSSNNVSNALIAASFFGKKVEHFQVIRNAQIHISASNMTTKLRSVIPDYVIASKPKYPYDIIESREISSGKIAIKAWVENMNDFLNYL